MFGSTAVLVVGTWTTTYSLLSRDTGNSENIEDAEYEMTLIDFHQYTFDQHEFQKAKAIGALDIELPI